MITPFFQDMYIQYTITIQYGNLNIHYLYQKLVMCFILTGIYLNLSTQYIYYMLYFPDTSFMYLTAWLLMLKIYQTRHPDINAHSHVAYFTLAIIIFVAVVGVVSWYY